MPSTTGMKGEGFYDRHSSGQRASIDALSDWIDAAAGDAVLPDDGRPFVAADFACSEGSNSLRFADRVVGALRDRDFDGPIVTVHSDLPTNNFNQLFLNLRDAPPGGGASRGVFHAVVAGSMYERLAPPASVHLAASFNALLWLDRPPAADLPTFVVFPGPEPWRPDVTVSPATAAAFAQQAASDLQRFLTARADETPPGGKLLLGVPGRDVEASTAQGIYDALNDACLDLASSGRIARESYEGLTMPLYFRTLDEMAAPVDPGGGPLADRYRVERAEVIDVPTPFVVQFDRDGDAARLAAEQTGFLRAFSEPIVATALAGDGNGAVDAVYARVEERIAAEPERYRLRYKQLAVLMTRR